MSIIFDITTPQKAMEFLLTNLRFSNFVELSNEFNVNCERDLDVFAERNLYTLDIIDIFNVHFIAFHVTGSIDNCDEIKRNGICNLQYVLSQETKLKELLNKVSVCFNIPEQKVIINGNEYNINYDYYRTLGCRLTPQEKALKNIAHKVYYDYGINGFWYCEHPEDYGTDIHKRPEILLTLSEAIPQTSIIGESWKENSVAYKIFFYAKVGQLEKYSFGDNLDKDIDTYDEYE